MRRALVPLIAILAACGTATAVGDGGGGPGNEKLPICHVPPGNPANAHIIHPDDASYDAHLPGSPGGHDTDFFVDAGHPCPAVPATTTTERPHHTTTTKPEHQTTTTKPGHGTTTTTVKPGHGTTTTVKQTTTTHGGGGGTTTTIRTTTTFPTGVTFGVTTTTTRGGGGTTTTFPTGVTFGVTTTTGSSTSTTTTITVPGGPPGTPTTTTPATSPPLPGGPTTTTTLPPGLPFSFGAAASVCVREVPTITITFVSPAQFPSLVGQTGTLTMADLNGNVVSTQPLVYAPGTTVNLLYPGTRVNADGSIADVPGWNLNAAGLWVRDPSDEFLREGIVLTYVLNPTATATVTYPPESSACANPDGPFPPGVTSPPARPPGQPGLPPTGSEDGVMAGIAFLVLASGTALFVVGRRRRSP